MLCPDERHQTAAPRAGLRTAQAQAVRRAGAAGRGRRARRARSRWSPWWRRWSRWAWPPGASWPPPAAPARTRAWNTTPKAADLPAGWSISASQYDVDRKQMTVVGPAPGRRQRRAGGRVRDHHVLPLGRRRRRDALRRRRDGRGPDGDRARRPGRPGVQRHGPVERRRSSSSATATSSSTSPPRATPRRRRSTRSPRRTTRRSAATAARSRSAPRTPAPRPRPSDGGASPSDAAEATVSPAAPDLEAAIPATVGDIALGVQSATGADVLGDDPGARAVAAALRAAGHQPADLLVAYASDQTGASDLTITALSVDGMGAKAMRDLALNAWLPGSGAGVTQRPGDGRRTRRDPDRLRRRAGARRTCSSTATGCSSSAPRTPRLPPRRSRRCPDARSRDREQTAPSRRARGRVCSRQR